MSGNDNLGEDEHIASNPYIFSDGYQVTVYPRGGGWACTVAAVVEGEQQMHSRRNYPAQDAAKLAGFDQITKLMTRNRNL